MIGMKYRCCAAWAQLECHYGIAVMTHYLACCTPDPTSEVAAVQSSRHLFHFLLGLWIQTMDKNKDCVGEMYYSESWRAAKIRSPPSGPERPADTVLIISLLLSCTTMSLQGFLLFMLYLCFLVGYGNLLCKPWGNWSSYCMCQNYIKHMKYKMQPLLCSLMCYGGILTLHLHAFWMITDIYLFKTKKPP